MSVETAYKAVHFDELTHGLMVQTEKDAKKKVADSIRSGGGRPTENGVGAGSANGTKVDARDLSPEEFIKSWNGLPEGKNYDLKEIGMVKKIIFNLRLFEGPANVTTADGMSVEMKTSMTVT